MIATQTRGVPLAQLIVRNLDEGVKRGLQERARRHGKSVEAEVRDILAASVAEARAPAAGLGTAISARFAGAGLDEPIPEWRGTPVKPADFGA